MQQGVRISFAYRSPLALNITPPSNGRGQLPSNVALLCTHRLRPQELSTPALGNSSSSGLQLCHHTKRCVCSTYVHVQSHRRHPASMHSASAKCSSTRQPSAPRLTRSGPGSGGGGGGLRYREEPRTCLDMRACFPRVYREKATNPEEQITRSCTAPPEFRLISETKSAGFLVFRVLVELYYFFGVSRGWNPR